MTFRRDTGGDAASQAPRCEHCGGVVLMATDGNGALVSECADCRLFARVKVRRGVPLDPPKGGRPTRPLKYHRAADDD